MAPSVTVQPADVVFPAQLGDTIMAAAVTAGLRWPTICGGRGECRVCFVEVLEHPDRLEPPDIAESDAVGDLRGDHGGRGAHVRLACRAKVLGDVVVAKRGVRHRKAKHE